MKSSVNNENQINTLTFNLYQPLHFDKCFVF